LGSFWFWFGNGLVFAVCLIIVAAIVDVFRRLVIPPPLQGDVLYSEMGRPVRVNRFPFQYKANISISQTQICIEPHYIFSNMGQISLPRVVLELCDVQQLELTELGKYSVKFEYPQKIGSAIWLLGFEFPYSAFQCLAPWQDAMHVTPGFATD